MPVRDVQFSSRRLFQTALLASVSALTLLTAVTPAQAGDLLKGNRYASPTMSASAAAAALASVKQAQQATAAARNSLAAATRAIQVMQQNQASWRNLSLSTITNVPNGLAPDGLQVAPNVGTDPTLWQGAKGPVQTSSNGQTTVTIDQTAQKSILTWQSYNVGRDTTVYYNQSGGNQSNGNNNWISLNRIVDPSDHPSEILGQIKAEGSVYLINRNGIVFGGSSQVNVHSLVASSLGFLGENIAGLTAGSAQYDAAVSASNAMFLNTNGGGIAARQSSGATPVQDGNLVLGVGSKLTGTDASNFVPGGAIEIDAGATISTHANGTASDGGFVLIAAPTIRNDGTITATDGQAILAAGIGVSLVQNNSKTPQFLVPELSGQISVNGLDTTPAGSLTNTGMIEAATGNVSLLGTNMVLGGVIGVTTSVSRPGSIVISTVDEADIGDLTATPPDRRAGELVVSGTIANLPEEDDQTVPANGNSFTPGSIALTGGSLWLQGGALIEAPGANVSLAAVSPTVAKAPPGDNGVAGRVYLDNGATVSVAGLSDIELPMSDILVDIPLLGGNELADSPLLRTLLKDLADVVIDSTQAGTRADGLSWVGSPIVNAAGYVGLIPAKIDQLLTNGGTVTLSGGQVMTAAGSMIDLDGGFVHYLGGYVNTTKLLDSAGHVVDIGDADPNDIFVGVANQFVVHHDHWGIIETFNTSLTPKGTYRPDFIEGGNAGTLNVFSSQAMVLDGMVSAQAFPGLQQVAAGQAPSGTTPGGSFLPEGGSFDLGAGSGLAFPGDSDLLKGQSGSVIIRDKAPDLNDLGANFGAETPLDMAALNALGADDPDNILAWTTLPTDMIADGGFANVTVTMAKTLSLGQIVVAQGSSLTVQAGGSINLTNPSPASIDILGDLTAASGTITIASSKGTVTVGPDAVISTAGLWVNDASLDADATGADNFVNGGSISISAGENNGGIGIQGPDTSGSILLQAGSVLDVSSGGVMLPGGVMEMADGIPTGKGGNVSLLTYFSSGAQFGGGDATPPVPTTQPTNGRLEMDGTIDSWGFAGGGTLTLQALGFQIGGDPSQAPSWDLYLPTDFFANQGFGSYQINAMYDATVADDTVVRLTQRNLIPNIAALAQAPTGSDLNAGGLTSLGVLDPYHRQPTNFVMTAGGYLSWRNPDGSTPQYAGVPGAVTIGEGVSLIADAGANIGLGSPSQVTVLGSIIAPGGSITLSADSENLYGFAQPGHLAIQAGFTSDSKSVWLGSDAVLDVSGIALTDPFAIPVRVDGLFTVPVTGKVLDGGSVVLSDDSGYVVTAAGSIIDISGTSAKFDLPQAGIVGLDGQSYASQDVWSNAGSITFAASSGLYADGTIEAQAGAPQGQGGTLAILPELQSASGFGPSLPSAKAIIIQQSGDFVPAGLAPGQSFGGTPTGVLHFAADRLDGSGIDTLVVGEGTDAGGGSLQVVPVAFAGDVKLSLGNAVVFNTTELVALPAGATTLPTLANGVSSVGGTSVSISAPYVAIAGPVWNSSVVTQPITTASLADGTFNVNATFIDLENQVSLENFGNANFTSSGDIRLSSTNAASNSALAPGLLYTPGNLTFTAADLYPSSGSSFILDAAGPNPTTITFLSNGASSVPLSAGGSLLIDATDIVQAGTIRAPSGTIILGVGDASDTDTQAQFDSLPLTNTDSVTLADGSITSVSLDDTVIPYGTTLDGTGWQYNAPTGGSGSDLKAPPAKVITVNGANVALDNGAVIDLSGGGDLQAIEWVAGNGGTRDVLSQYNVTYPASGEAVAAPLYPDARDVYAILPGAQSPVAAYDPVYAQSLQPDKAANGEASSKTMSSGVGKATLGGQVGQSVYLSGVPGLPDGIYTLLPAKYATLPGAYRIVENTSAGTVAPGQSVTLADGTQVVSGYYVDGLNGARDATPSQFEVQSRDTWEQYSQYNLSSANSFDFTEGHTDPTTLPARLPMDAGQLVLGATGSLTLDTTLRASAAPGGKASEVDIASQDIQIVGGNEPALAGYLQISADGLTELGAGSLLIGGIRSSDSTTDNTTGENTNSNDTGDDDTPHPVTSIDALANSVVVSNDAEHPLTGPEIMFVTKTDPSGADANAATGLRIDGGSVIQAKGTISADSDHDIRLSDASGSGDGSLLMVTNGALVGINRGDLPATSQASLTVGAGATIDGGAALVLDSSGALTFDPTATFSGTDIAVDAALITLTNATGSASSSLPGFVVGPNSLAQFAQSQKIDLRSYSDIDFDGTVDLSFGEAVTLSAGDFVGSGDVMLSGQQIAFTNDLDATALASTAGAGSLTVNAGEIDFGDGDAVLSGFNTVTMTASGGIVGKDIGSFDLGAADATLTAPIYLADTSSDATLKTTGVLNLNSNTGTALASDAIGGAINFIGGALNDNGAQISAPAGNVSLEATTGDLTLAAGSLVSSAGLAKQFFDVTAYAPAGNITLTADTGTINVQSGATLDFSGNAGGGAAGSLTLSAPGQVVNLNGTVKGSAATGYLGGSFSIDTGGAVDLDNLAAELASSGVNDAITVQSGAGNLTLSAGNTLTAHVVSLTADGGAGGQGATDGNVNINGIINASGNAGGEIDLYGKSGVDLEGSLIATGSSPTQRGGTVNIGTVGNANTDPVTGIVEVDPTYGYELVSSTNSGTIKLGANALIDVSGGTAGGLSNGTVSFRAPLLDTGDVNVTIAPTAIIRGSRATTLEAYAVWSTDDPTTGAQHFDGIVDPAGWYDATGTLVRGAFTDASGNTVASWDGTTLSNSDNTTNDLAYYLANDTFAPTAGDADTAHQAFYGYASSTTNSDGSVTTTPGTLMSFVENLPVSSSAASRFASRGITVTPGIELDNPDANINNGNISVLTNWNLGSGASEDNLDFRFNGVAPIITFKAENDVKVDASLSDGFFQVANPISPGSVTQTFIPDPSNITYLDTLYSSTAVATYYLSNYGPNSTSAYAGVVSAPTLVTDGDAEGIAEYYALYEAYAKFLLSTPTAGTNAGAQFMNAFYMWSASTFAGTPIPAPTPPSRSLQASDPFLYLQYLQAYENYFYTAPAFTPIQLLQAPIPEAVAMLPAGTPATGGSIITTTIPPALDNTPSPIATAANPLPLSMASLAGGASSSFRIVAGANMASADPLSLQALPSGTDGDDHSVSLDGHTVYMDANGQPIAAPTMIRTGTGSIDIAAANDVALLDMTAPGVIYTAGAPADGAPVGTTSAIAAGDPTLSAYDLLVTNAVNPDAAGDISIKAGNDITGVENVIGANGGSQDGPGYGASQFWWQWMEIAAVPTNITVNGQTTVTPITQTSIDFGAFDQGVMSIGGDVSISAGGDVTNLSVSLPTTWYLSNNNQTVNTVGGGNLTVTAGGDILSGDYFVAKGTGTITAGGRIGSSGLISSGPFGTFDEVSTILAAQDGVLDVSARLGVDIGAMVDPSYIQGPALDNGYLLHADSQSYSPSSALNVVTATGDVDFNTLASLGLLSAGTPGTTANDNSYVLPATLNLTAFGGGISIERPGELYPSATGQLSLIADQSVYLHSSGIGAVTAVTAFGLIDAPASALPSPLNPVLSTLIGVTTEFDGDLTSAALIDHTLSPLHADDDEPVRIYSLTGSIIDGHFETSGLAKDTYDDQIQISVDKPALIQAGEDIIDLAFLGQNLREDDITRVIAGRDIWDTPNPSLLALPSIFLGGPGTFDIEAGGSIGPLSPSAQSRGHVTGGIVAIGNQDNPNLPHESANVQVLFGTGPGIDTEDFIAQYIAPGASIPGIDTTPGLIAFMEQYDEGQVINTGLVKDKLTVTLTADQAWTQFQALPETVQRLFAEQVLFQVLSTVGRDYHDPSSPFANQYARGYQAISTLFPADLGYTANSLNGGNNGEATPVPTGSLDMRNSTIQTQQGGNITILGPGGQALVGSSSAPPVVVDQNGNVIVGPGDAGILTLEQGNVDIFTDTSLLLAQSRVFTEQGGDMTIWSSNGDINAGKGAKTVSDVPPPAYVSDDDHYNTLDARGEVTGAGIATLQSIPGVAPGDIFLIAPRGTVDAGDAGIRFSGDIFVAALTVANANNFQGAGKEVGVPGNVVVDTGALSAAGNTAGAASNAANKAARQTGNRSSQEDLPSIITVQVIGYGGDDGDGTSAPAPQKEDDKRKKKAQQQSYNSNSAVQFVGLGGSE